MRVRASSELNDRAISLYDRGTHRHRHRRSISRDPQFRARLAGESSIDIFAGIETIKYKGREASWMIARIGLSGE